MKKLLKNFALVAGLVALSSVLAKAATVSATISSTTITTPSDVLMLNKYESLTYTLTGTATGQIRIEKTETGSNWETVTSFTGAGVVSETGKLYSRDRVTFYRWRASTMTAGSFVVSLYDNDDVVQEFKNNKGVPTVVVTDDGITVSGTIVASSASLSATTLVSPTLISPTLTSPTIAGTATDSSTATYSGTQTFNGKIVSGYANNSALVVQSALSGDALSIWLDNTSDTATSDARFLIRTAGQTANDPYINFRIINGASWAVGVDNSASDTFVISQGNGLATNPAISITSTTLHTSFVGGSMKLYDRTLAQLRAITPTATGQQYNCTDCSSTPVCISTGTSIAAFSGLNTKTTVCQ